MCHGKGSEQMQIKAAGRLARWLVGSLLLVGCGGRIGLLDSGKDSGVTGSSVDDTDGTTANGSGKPIVARSSDGSLDAAGAGMGTSPATGGTGDGGTPTTGGTGDGGSPATGGTGDGGTPETGGTIAMEGPQRRGAPRAMEGLRRRAAPRAPATPPGSWRSPPARITPVPW